MDTDKEILETPTVPPRRGVLTKEHISLMVARLKMQHVFDAVAAERAYGDHKHGPIDGKGGHSLGEWIILAEAELAEAKLALIKGGKGRNAVRAEMCQVAAIMVAALEQHGTVDTTEERQV